MKVFVDTNLLLDVLAKREPFFILNQAIDSEIRDFEDAIQFYSALHAHANFLVTRNVGDFPVGTLPVLTPNEFLALLDHAGKGSQPR